jgi:hypothetical protein
VHTVLLIREIEDCFLEALGLTVSDFHALILAPNRVLVNDIITLFRATYRTGEVVWNQRMLLRGKSLCRGLFRVTTNLTDLSPK